MRISDWSSDVCSSDLLTEAGRTLHATTAPKALDIERRIFAHFEPEEVERFEAMLRRIDRIAFDLAAEEEQRKAGEPKRSEEHTSELQSLMRISYADFCLKKKI